MTISIRKAKSDDVGAILELIRELAEFEKAPQEVSVTLAQLIEDGFGSNPLFECYLAEMDGKVAGMAFTYHKYSTWKGKCLFLEDLIVKRDMRGNGVGKALFEFVIEKAKTEGLARLEWQVLDWNTPAVDFYKSYGAQISTEWWNGRIIF